MVGNGPDLDDQDYMTWKDWNAEVFGYLSRTEKAFYSSEIKKLDYVLERNANILEIGFGPGHFLSYASQMGWRVVGLEKNNELLELARQKNYEVYSDEYINDLPKNHFDLVVAFDVFEHLSEIELLETLLKIKKLMKTGCSIIARVPNGDSPFALKGQNGDITHKQFLGSGKIKYFAKKTNFSLVYISGESTPFVGVHPLFTIQRVFSVPIKYITNSIINLFFFPGENVQFLSSSLIFQLKK